MQPLFVFSRLAVARQAIASLFLIVKFSGCEKFITVKDKRLGIKAIRTSYPQPIQLYIFVLYFIHNNKEALTFLISTYND